MTVPTSPRRPRLPPVAPDRLDPAGRVVYQAICDTRSSNALFQLTNPDGSLTGPFNAMVVAPVVGGPLAELGAAIRYKSSLSARNRELAILLTALDADCSFEWNAHVPIARSAGLTEEFLNALRSGGHTDGQTLGVEATLTTVRRMLKDRHLNENDYDAARREFGHVGLIELVVLIGYYRTLALLMELFEIDEPLTNYTDSSVDEPA